MSVSDIAYSLEKPFALVVETEGKTLKREFDTEAEVIEFAKTVKEKFPTATAQFIRRKERKRGREGQADSIGFIAVYDREGRPHIDAFGKRSYKPVLVPVKKGHYFCSNCHDYKTFTTLLTPYGLDYMGCPECGISTNDFDIKTCNGLWERRSK